MLRLNRTTEYALIALRYIQQKKSDDFTSAREIAVRFDLPFEILAKTLQKLKESGFIQASYGTKGGYVFKANLSQTTLFEFLNLMEGCTNVVCCITSERSPKDCNYMSRCNIQPAMGRLNDRFQAFLNQITLEELLEDRK